MHINNLSLKQDAIVYTHIKKFPSKQDAIVMHINKFF